jgi:hypothetical protein
MEDIYEESSSLFLELSERRRFSLPFLGKTRVTKISIAYDASVVLICEKDMTKTLNSCFFRLG